MTPVFGRGPNPLFWLNEPSAFDFFSFAFRSRSLAAPVTLVFKFWAESLTDLAASPNFPPIELPPNVDEGTLGAPPLGFSVRGAKPPLLPMIGTPLGACANRVGGLATVWEPPKDVAGFLSVGLNVVG